MKVRDLYFKYRYMTAVYSGILLGLCIVLLSHNFYFMVIPTFFILLSKGVVFLFMRNRYSQTCFINLLLVLKCGNICQYLCYVFLRYCCDFNLRIFHYTDIETGGLLTEVSLNSVINSMSNKINY